MHAIHSAVEQVRRITRVLISGDQIKLAQLAPRSRRDRKHLRQPGPRCVDVRRSRCRVALGSDTFSWRVDTSSTSRLDLHGNQFGCDLV